MPENAQAAGKSLISGRDPVEEPLRGQGPDDSLHLRHGQKLRIRGEYGFVLSHPSGKNKDAARVGHPAFEFSSTWVRRRANGGTTKVVP